MYRRYSASWAREAGPRRSAPESGRASSCYSRVMNPYESFLAGGDALATIQETAARLEKAVQARDTETLNRVPAPGKWSVRDILAHLADCEVVFAFRLRQALAEDYHVVQPFDQDRWAATYPQSDARTAL